MATLYDIYKNQGKALPKTAEERFADPQFAAAAQQAGITKDQYAVNQGNAIMNTQIANLYGKSPTPATPQNITQPSPSTAQPTVASNINLPTIGDSYSQDPIYISAMNVLKNNASGTDIVDQSAIRSKAIADMQDRINALNQVYTNQLNTAKTQGQGRIGQTTSLLANRGLAGSARGGAIGQTTLDQNTQIENAILAEQNAAIQAIYNDANNYAVAEAQRRREALTSGAKTYIDYLKSQDTTKTENINAIGASLLAQGIDINKLTPEDMKKLQETATRLGTNTDAILSAYKQAKFTKDLEDKKNTQKSASVQEYEYAKLNGYTGSFTDYQTEDANRKAITKNDSLTPYQQFSATQSIAKDTQARTANAREMARQASLIQSSYDNILGGGDRSLNTQAIITSFNKILDPTSVVRESEYDRTAEGQALIDRLRGKVDNITKGGAGVTQQTLKEAADIAKTYLESSQRSINEQNARAEQMAAQFGLNPNFVTTGSSNYTETGGVVTGQVGKTAKGGLSF